MTNSKVIIISQKYDSSPHLNKCPKWEGYRQLLGQNIAAPEKTTSWQIKEIYQRTTVKRKQHRYEEKYHEEEEEVLCEKVNAFQTRERE